MMGPGRSAEPRSFSGAPFDQSTSASRPSIRRRSRGPRLGLAQCVGQALATEAIAECIRSGSVWEAESNVEWLDLVVSWPLRGSPRRPPQTTAAPKHPAGFSSPPAAARAALSLLTAVLSVFLRNPFVQVLTLEIGKLGRKKPAIPFNVLPMVPHLGCFEVSHPPSPPRMFLDHFGWFGRRARRGVPDTLD